MKNTIPRSNPGPQAAQHSPGLTGGVWLHLFATLGEKGDRGMGVRGQEKALIWRFMVLYSTGHSQEDSEPNQGL